MTNPVISRQDNQPLILDHPLSERGLTVAQDASAAIPVGSVMGIISMQTTTASVTVSAISGTGDGTCVKDASTPVLAGAKVGVYRIKCISAGAAAHHSTWEVRDPDGVLVGTFSITATGGSYTFANQIKFALTDGSTDFGIGAYFDFTIAAASGSKLKRCDSTAVDGSQYPVYVATQEIDATAGDVSNCNFVKSAYVRSAGLVFTGSETVATVVPGVRGGTFKSLLEAKGFELITGSTAGQYDNE